LTGVFMSPAQKKKIHRRDAESAENTRVGLSWLLCVLYALR
jgi:hypothetical protein